MREDDHHANRVQSGKASSILQCRLKGFTVNTYLSRRKAAECFTKLIWRSLIFRDVDLQRLQSSKRQLHEYLR